MSNTVNGEFEDGFDEKAFWKKAKRYARVAGYELMEKALWLYYATQSSGTPAWAKSVIYGALAYFVLPIDAIPDLLPIAGFTDDLGALAAALVSVAPYIDDDVKRRTEATLKSWFGVGPDVGDLSDI
ncbi:MAG: DUF1232 domain-containing protein [Pseudomonadota bacterium]